jgi:hypothetical protein
VTLTNVTVTGNSAGSAYHGGGLFATDVPPLLHNTIVAGNYRGGSTRDDVSGALAGAGDYNLIGDGTGMTGVSAGVNHNQVGSGSTPLDPGLGPLANNGGPTLTHAVLSGSPAYRAGGTAYATATDQRGLPRVVGGFIDVGAYETQ